jgi:hypothetical protein
MRFMFRSLTTAAAVIVLSGAAYAAPQAKTALAKPAKTAKVTGITATGTVSKFDTATNMLTVTTAKGDATFRVDPSATVTANGKKVMTSDLPSHVGHKVTVRYTESGGQKMAQSIRLSMAAPKTASVKKASTGKKS